MQSFNSVIIDNIKRQLPVGVKLVDYLMEHLSLDRGPAYKRMNSTIPFTLNETAIIAQKLNLSFDTLLLNRNNNSIITFTLPPNANIDAYTKYKNWLIRTTGFLQIYNAAINVSTVSATNILPWHLFRYPSLFKIDYIQQQILKNSTRLGVKFSDIEIPQEILQLQKQCAFEFLKTKNYTLIIDRNLIKRECQKIQLFMECVYLTEEEKQEVKRELLAFLDFAMNQVTTKNINLYVSHTAIDAYSSLYKYDNNTACVIMTYPTTAIMIRNNDNMTDLQTDWLASKLNNSVLVTGSNEIERIKLHQESYNTVLEELLPDK